MFLQAARQFSISSSSKIQSMNDSNNKMDVNLSAQQDHLVERSEQGRSKLRKIVPHAPDSASGIKFSTLMFEMF